jgi:transcription initiation factor TFIIH subunit 2
VVGVGASVNVCQVLANKTSGLYHVGGDEEQLRELVLFHATPPPLTPQMLREFPAELIEMGFPQHLRSDVEVLSAVTHEFVKEGYLCPRCKAMLEELPSTCPICRLSCVASPHLARSFHHLFPVPLFEKVARSGAAAASPRPAAGDKEKGAAAEKVAAAAATATRTCSGCSRCIRPEEMCFRCPRQNALQTVDAAAAPEGLGTRRTGVDEAVYCMDCDVFIHDVLHNTPPPVSAASAQRADDAARRAGEGGSLRIKEEAGAHA